MQTIWNLNDNDRLIVFFSGWGMDDRSIAHLNSEGWDVCTCYDYTDLYTDDVDSWKSYDTVLVVAWSMGVWAAEAVAARENFYIDAAIAINGTPYPVHDKLGIPSEIAWSTHDNLDDRNLEKFYRRIFGGAGQYRKLIEVLPEKTDLEKLREELAAIFNGGSHNGNIKWNLAVISEEDKIFPVPNLKKYWEKRCRTKEIKAPHYPFHLIKRWEDVIDGW